MQSVSNLEAYFNAFKCDFFTEWNYKYLWCKTAPWMSLVIRVYTIDPRDRSPSSGQASLPSGRRATAKWPPSNHWATTERLSNGHRANFFLLAKHLPSAWRAKNVFWSWADINKNCNTFVLLSGCSAAARWLLGGHSAAARWSLSKRSVDLLGHCLESALGD